MEERVRSAIRTYLENHGWTLYQSPEYTDYFVGHDGKNLVFIKYAWTEEATTFPDEEPIDRAQAEQVTLAYMCKHPDIKTGAIRYDYITLVRISDNKAAIRHHRNVLA